MVLDQNAKFQYPGCKCAILVIINSSFSLTIAGSKNEVRLLSSSQSIFANKINQYIWLSLSQSFYIQ